MSRHAVLCALVAGCAWRVPDPAPYDAPAEVAAKVDVALDAVNDLAMDLPADVARDAAPDAAPPDARDGSDALDGPAQDSQVDAPGGDVVAENPADAVEDNAADAPADASTDLASDALVDATDATVDALIEASVDARTDAPADLGAEVFSDASSDSAEASTTDVFLPSLRFRSLSLGARHSCGVTFANDLYCWGDNTEGQLGDGTLTDRSIATPTMLGIPVVEVAAGRGHTCARSASGAVYCWGNNADGQLGDTTFTSHPLPAIVRDLDRNTVDLVVGADHACALLTDHTVRCWGANADGQLGDATTARRPRQNYVAGLFNVSSILSGTRHSCAMVAGRLFCGAVGYDVQLLRCWGANDHGQLGDGSYTPRRTPVAVGVLNVSCASAEAPSAGGDHTCARSGATLYCWGANDRGQLGTGDLSDATDPEAVFETGVFGVTYTPVLGGAHSCAIRNDGVTLCWGANDRGQLGLGDRTDRVNLSPSAAPPEAIAAVYAGGEHTCEVTSEGVAYCFGRNDHGQLGVGDRADRSRPVRVTP